MATVVTSLILLIVASSISYLVGSRRKQKPESTSNNYRNDPEFRTLFPVDEAMTREDEKQEKERVLSDRVSGLRAKAAEGKLEVLVEAQQLGDGLLCSELLDKLSSWHQNRGQLLALADYFENLSAPPAVAGGPLRSTPNFVEDMLAAWRMSPTRKLTAQLLHLAALSDEAAIYQKAVEEVTWYWRLDRLPGLAANELAQLIDLQYWVLSSEARRSGAGFLLKRCLVGVRRELNSAKRRASV